MSVIKKIRGKRLSSKQKASAEQYMLKFNNDYNIALNVLHKTLLFRLNVFTKWWEIMQF